MCSGESIGYFLFVESANSTSPYSCRPSSGLTSSRRSIFGDISASFGHKGRQATLQLRLASQLHLRPGQLCVNGLAHRIEVMPLSKLGAVNEDRGRTVDPLCLARRYGGLDACSLLAAVEALVECRRVQSQGFGHLLEAS